MAARMTAGKGGEYYVPYENRKGCESIVYFTRDLSAEGLEKIYKKADPGSRTCLRKSFRILTARRSSRPTPTMPVTATRPKSTARPWK